MEATQKKEITESDWENWMLSATRPNLARLADIEDRIEVCSLT